MNRLTSSRRAGKKAGSLDDSASDSGKILSYQRMPQDSPVKAVPLDGTAELSSQPSPAPVRAKHRTKAMTDPSYRCASATGRSEPYFSSETSRSRLSSANLEQNHHVYRNHPQNLDYHERTRQWLKSAELSAPAGTSTRVTRKSAPASQKVHRHQHYDTQPPVKKRSGLLSMFDCFKPQTEGLQQSPITRK